MTDTWSVNTENWAISDEGVYIDNSEFISVELDSENKLISGRKINGTKIENVGFETPLLRIEDVAFKSIDNSEFISVELDCNGNIIEATTKDSKTIYCDFRARRVSAKVLIANEIVSSIIKTQNLKLNGLANIELKKTMGLMPIDQTNLLNAFVSLVRNATGLIESFVFFSDLHLFVNYNKGEYNDSKIQYLDKISKYFRSTPTDFVLCGGDLLNSHKQSAAADALSWIDSFANKSFNSQFYYMNGNHDTNYQGKLDETEDKDINDGILNNQQIINLMYRKYGKIYYTFKGNNTKFFIFDSGIDSVPTMNEYRWQQVNWFANELLSNNEQHIIIALHIIENGSKTFGEQVAELADNILKVSNAFNNRSTITLNENTYNFNASTGIVHCALCGHTHYDVTAIINGIPVLCIRDAYTNGDFDLILVDYNIKVLKTIRVGYGENRMLNIN